MDCRSTRRKNEFSQKKCIMHLPVVPANWLALKQPIRKPNIIMFDSHQLRPIFRRERKLKGCSQHTFKELIIIQYSSFDFIKFSLGQRCSVVYIIYPSCVNNMSWFVVSDQIRHLSLLWRRHKVKACLHRTDEAQNQAETRVCSYPVPC